MIRKLRYFSDRSNVFIVAIGLIVTFCTFYFLRDLEHGRVRSKFIKDATIREDIFRLQIQIYLNDLESLRNYYNSMEVVDRESFKKFARSVLEDRQDIQALEWSPRVESGKGAYYENAAREDGIGDFEIREKPTDGLKDDLMVRAGQRDVYYPVFYVEPFFSNERAVGFDLGSNPTRLAAIEKSRDTGQPVATARITLVQEKENQFGFLVVIPIYNSGLKPSTVQKRQEQLKGFVLGVFRVGTFFEKAMSAIEPAGVHVYLFDQSAPVKERLLYTHTSRLENQKGFMPETEKEIDDPFRLKYMTEIEVAGRLWKLVFTPSSGYLSTYRGWGSWIGLITGLLITGCFVIYVSGIRHRTKNIQALVDDRTAELQKTLFMLQTIMNSADFSMISTDPDGIIKTFSAGASRLLGYTQEEVIDKVTPAIIHDTDEVIERARQLSKELGRSIEPGFEVFVAKARDNVAEEHEWTYISKDGTRFPVLLSVTAVRNETDEIIGFLGIGADITKRKQAEKKLLENEAYIRATVDNIIAGINTID